MRYTLPIVSVLALGVPAFGQTVDSQGASRLTEALSRYVTSDAFGKGVLAVTVDGDAYKITVDFTALAALMPKQDLAKFEIGAYSFKVKPRGDGKWDVAGDLIPNGSFEANGPDGLKKMQWTVVDGKFEGVYDPELAAFVSGSGSQTGLTMRSSDPKSQMDASIGAGTLTMEGTGSATGGVDFTSKQTMNDFLESIKVDDPETGINLPVTIRAREVSLDATGKGLRTKPFLDLVEFGVANGEETKLKANQAELKSLLLAALPLWDRIDGSYRFSDFAAESQVGSFGAKEFGVTVGMDGIGKEGTLNYTFNVTGPKLPEQLLPAWSVPLLPTDISLSIGGTNIDLDGVARKAIEAFDLNQDPPISAEVGAALSAAMMANLPKVVISRSIVTNRDSEIGVEGEVTFPDGKPEVNMTVDATGYDRIVEALQAAAATDPQAGQYLPAMLAVKGFAKTLPDGRIQWAINRAADGSVRVNGVMLKPADPSALETDELQDGGASEPGQGDGGAILAPQ